MEFANKLVLNSGFVFDYTNMLGEGRIKTEDLQEMETAMQKARDAVNEMRSSGTAYNHLSKDGTPEPVYFTRLPEIKNGNPNTPVSLQKLKEFGDYLRTNVDAVVFLGVGGSYLGNKVLFDIGAGPSWNSMGEKRRNGYPRIYFSGNNLDAGQCEEIMNELRYWSVHAWPKKKQRSKLWLRLFIFMKRVIKALCSIPKLPPLQTVIPKPVRRCLRWHRSMAGGALILKTALAGVSAYLRTRGLLRLPLSA